MDQETVNRQASIPRICCHERIRRPTRCVVCQEFICNQCHGKGAPYGCRTQRGVDGHVVAFGCGKRIGMIMCRARDAPWHAASCSVCDRGDPERTFSYRNLEHPGESSGATPCEACICGLGARHTCPKCHGVGQPYGDCICGKRISAKYCPMDCRGTGTCGDVCDASMLGPYRYFGAHIHHHRRTRGFCAQCACPRIAEWREQETLARYSGFPPIPKPWIVRPMEPTCNDPGDIDSDPFVPEYTE